MRKKKTVQQQPELLGTYVIDYINWTVYEPACGCCQKTAAYIIYILYSFVVCVVVVVVVVVAVMRCFFLCCNKFWSNHAVGREKNKNKTTNCASFCLSVGVLLGFSRNPQRVFLCCCCCCCCSWDAVFLSVTAASLRTSFFYLFIFTAPLPPTSTFNITRSK